jgi:hypothetical protein
VGREHLICAREHRIVRRHEAFERNFPHLDSLSKKKLLTSAFVVSANSCLAFGGLRRGVLQIASQVVTQ